MTFFSHCPTDYHHHSHALRPFQVIICPVYLWIQPQKIFTLSLGCNPPGCCHLGQSAAPPPCNATGYVVSVSVCHCITAKDLLSKLHNGNDAHCTVPVEREASWFLKIGKLYSHLHALHSLQVSCTHWCSCKLFSVCLYTYNMWLNALAHWPYSCVYNLQASVLNIVIQLMKSKSLSADTSQMI